jgi:hypothetical protein
MHDRDARPGVSSLGNALWKELTFNIAISDLIIA